MTNILLALILAVLLLTFAAVRRGLLLAVIMLLILWAIGHEETQHDPETVTPPTPTMPPRRIIQQ
jgi:hypothetical protein